MIRIHPVQQRNDVPLVATTFHSDHAPDPLVRLVPEPLIPAEKLTLETFGFTEKAPTQVGYTPKRAIGFPAWPILTDPGNAQHALNLVQDVEWARRKAKNEAGAVKKRIDQLTGALQASAPHFLPTFFEEIARIFVNVDNPTYAKQYFGKARDVERTHNLAVDTERHGQAFAEFAALGIVSAKAFSQEARDAATRLEPENAYEYFFALLIEQAKTGAPLYANAFKDLEFLGKNAGKSPREVDRELTAAYLPTRSFPRSSEPILKKIVSSAPALLKTQPELGHCFYATIPALWDADQYVNVLCTLELWEPLCANATTFTSWVETIVAHGNTAEKFFYKSNPDLLDALVENTEALAGLSLGIVSAEYHLDYLDAFTAASTKWEPVPGRYVSRSPYNFDRWFNHHHRDLSFLITREDLREQVVEYFPSVAFREHLDVLLDSQSTRQLLEWKLENFRTLREKATGSKEEWFRLSQKTQYITDPRILKLHPELVAEILHVDPAVELAERLRRGTLVEYAWPAFEENIGSILRDNTEVTATYPWVCIRSGKDLLVLNGDVVRTYRLASKLHARVIPTDDDVLLTFYDSSADEEKWMWVSENTIYPLKDTRYSGRHAEYVSTIDGTLYVGPVAIRNGKLQSAPRGYQVGFGPVYAVNDEFDESVTFLPGTESIALEEFSVRFAQGDVLGLEIPEAIAVAASNGAEFCFETSFTAPVTDTTAQSPFGVDGDRLYGISLTKKSVGSWYISPLGTFQSDGEFVAIQKPLTGAWYLRRHWRSAHMLYDAATDTLIAPSLTHDGKKHLLHLLPPAAFHHLKVRNEKVSAKMRACTVDGAAKLIANPLSILDFAENDSVLAAAIAGIIAEFGEINTADIHLPALDTVPQELEYLYPQLTPVLVAEPAESTIPLPPHRPGDENNKFRDKEFRNLAQILANPQDSGEVEIGWNCRHLVETIGREKIWLARLSTPGIPLDEVQFYCAFLHWCADYGVLGAWHQLSDVNYHRKDSWVNKQLFLQPANGVLWNPDLTQRPTNKSSWSAFDGDLFVPKTEFKQALDKILVWHEKRHAEGMEMVPAWGDVTVAEAAEHISGVTVLPPRHWEYLFTGALDYPLTWQSGYLEWNSGNNPEKVSTMLGYPVREITSYIKSHLHLSHRYWHQFCLGLAWHTDYLTQGPNIAAIATAWAKQWGKPWINLTNEMWDTLPSRLHDSISYDFYRVAKSISRDKVETLAKLLPTYLNVAQLVEPSSAAAKNLAANIAEAKKCKVQDPNVPLGGDYSSPLFKNSTPAEHALRLAKEGYLDSLLTYLTSGKAVEEIEEDPTVSAPNIVADAAETLGISTDAARYFLQLLALTRPTDTDVKKWNGWTKKHLDQLTEELLEKELVVAAKRAGTGRKAFLPGGWLEKSTQGPAMEVWKAPHYLLWKDAKCRPIVETCPPLVPYPELFTEVWERYKSGDVPGYEELTTTRYRRKR